VARAARLSTLHPRALRWIYRETTPTRVARDERAEPVTSADQIQLDHIGPDDFAATVGGRTVGYVQTGDAGEFIAQFAGESAALASLEEVKTWFATRVNDASVQKDA
jgi:hypothetical protein